MGCTAEMPEKDDSVPFNSSWSAWLQKHRLEQLFLLESTTQHVYEDVAWEPSEADKLAAWGLHTELQTRVATQRLAFQTGDEDAALTSIYSLFDISRALISNHPGCTHFATLTTFILNAYVRPFTAEWHRVKVEGRLSNSDLRFRFRTDLRVLQGPLRDFTRLLGILAGYSEQIASSEQRVVQAGGASADLLWAPMSFGVLADSGLSVGIVARMNEKESKDIKDRRLLYDLKSAETNHNAIGLALSGGGIRSATFALGVVQVLAREGILAQVDYLSTVSGGGYIGSFLTSFLSDEDPIVSLNRKPGTLPFGAPGDPESKGVRQLRNHSKYLSEGGIRTYATMVALASYGILVSMLLLSPFLLTAVLIVKLCFSHSFVSASPKLLPLSNVTQAVLVILSAAVALLPVAEKFGRKVRPFNHWGALCVALASGVILLIAAEALPYLFYEAKQHGGTSRALTVAMLFPCICGVLGLVLGAQRLAGRALLNLLSLAGPLFSFAAFLWLYDVFAYSPSNSSLLILILITVGVWLYTSLVLNINFASPHSYYRDRLARTYLAKQAGEARTAINPQPLSTMNPQSKAPYHLINAALNIPACKAPNLRGRNTDFFLFSKHFCGSPIAGFEETLAWEKMDPHLDLGTAMAISGAAAAPHMGTLTRARYTFLLAMLNVRLGYWLRKPSGRNENALKRLLPPLGWYYFLRELTGLMSEKTAFLNVSDGGHIENLGIYELLRRRCKFIVAVDGEADPKRSFNGLLTLTQLAEIDLGVRIEPDLSDLRIDPHGHGRAHFGLSKIVYPDASLGLLLYIKSSLTGNESEFLKKYRDEHPDFPHQSTAQQLFGETQFEAYRALGEHVANDLFRSDLVQDWQQAPSVLGWFQSLATHLL
jgi:hypothetical protein